MFMPTHLEFQSIMVNAIYFDRQETIFIIIEFLEFNLVDSHGIQRTIIYVDFYATVACNI